MHIMILNKIIIFEFNGWLEVNAVVAVCQEYCTVHLLHTGKLKWLICGLNAFVFPVCLCINFPCALSLQSWSIIPVTVSIRTGGQISSTLCIIQLLENSSDYHSWITHAIICHRRFVDVYVYTKVCLAMCLCLHPLVLACIYENVWVCLTVMQWTNSVQWRVYFCNPIHKSRIRHKRWSNRDKLCS